MASISFAIQSAETNGLHFDEEAQSIRIGDFVAGYPSWSDGRSHRDAGPLCGGPAVIGSLVPLAPVVRIASLVVPGFIDSGYGCDSQSGCPCGRHGSGPCRCCVSCSHGSSHYCADRGLGSHGRRTFTKRARVGVCVGLAGIRAAATPALGATPTAAIAAAAAAAVAATTTPTSTPMNLEIEVPAAFQERPSIHDCTRLRRKSRLGNLLEHVIPPVCRNASSWRTLLSRHDDGVLALPPLRMAG